MAILGYLKQEATVEVDGQALQEYDVPKGCKVKEETDILFEMTDTAYTIFLDANYIPHVIKYVEVITGKPFGFQFRSPYSKDHGYDHLAIQAQCDSINTPLKHLPQTSLFN